MQAVSICFVYFVLVGSAVVIAADMIRNFRK